ncbi:hypothetical protein NE237_011546 [Protea cynaroides]|uniref:Uncharacterized protein n=1 Tax=Protea cynaroides TaxID=273540 RepID=A0A9Q0GVW2_9MAGN|nr:hypothetical protein NE237_011546 [Protea cynaroides]
MISPSRQLQQGDGSMQVQIGNMPRSTSGSGGSGGSSSMHSPHILYTPVGENGNNAEAEPTVNAPEKKLTLFALQLAVLEKMATAFGAMGFIWATVVLLGGFAIKITLIDFWFITFILFIEGARLFGRSHELEWQHQSTLMIVDSGIQRLVSNFRDFIIRTIRCSSSPISGSQSREVREQELVSNQPTRIWRPSEVLLLPFVGLFFRSKNISRLFSWLQTLSALACIALSVGRLIWFFLGANIQSSPDCGPDCWNMRPALYLFYWAALAEALLSLLEKVYWEWTIAYRKLLEEVNEECQLGSSGMVSIRRFFYDAYSECIKGSIFDGLKLDLVSFATELLESHFSYEQLIGAQILQKFSTNPQFSNDTLRKIGKSVLVIERLVEMLNWKNPREAEIRRAAAEILSKLARKKENSLRVAGIPGAMESIASLLYTRRSFDTRHSSDGGSDEIGEKEIIPDQPYYEFSVFNLLGLIILKNLAYDRGNCAKIGNTRGLLPQIIKFTHPGEWLDRDNVEGDSRLLAVEEALQVLMLLTNTAGTVGMHLREEIVEIVVTISNIREILKYGQKYPNLQYRGIKILINLTSDVKATETIGRTGGIIKELFQIFFQERNPENQNDVRVVAEELMAKKVRVAAGEVIAKLARNSNNNCYRILNQNVLMKLVEALKDSVLQMNSARILRNLCTYADDDCIERLKGVSAAAPTVLREIMSAENKLQEVMLGLAAQVFKFTNPQERNEAFNQSHQTGITEQKLAMKLQEILELYAYPSFEFPRMRRFAIELAISMIETNREWVHTFNDLGMKKALETLAETTSEIESFDIFDGIIGLSRHVTPIHKIVENALELLQMDEI